MVGDGIFLDPAPITIIITDMWRGSHTQATSGSTHVRGLELAWAWPRGSGRSGGVSMSGGPFPDLLGLTNTSRTSGGPEVLRGPDPFRHNIGVRKGSGNQLHPGEIWSPAGRAKN